MTTTTTTYVKPLDLVIGDRVNLGGNKNHSVVIGTPAMTKHGHVAIPYRNSYGRTGLYYAERNLAGVWYGIEKIVDVAHHDHTILGRPRVTWDGEAK